MAKLPFYYVYGNDAVLIERKWLADLKHKFAAADFTWHDATVDHLDVAEVLARFACNDLFNQGKVLVIRHPEKDSDNVIALAEGLKDNITEGSALVLLGESLNKTTKLGRLAKKHFTIREFQLPEVKPFDLLDAISSRNKPQVLTQCQKLLAADYHPLALYSMLCKHLLLMKQVKEREGQPVEKVARELKQHQYRVKKLVVANRYWSADQIDLALRNFATLGERLRTWQYDEEMLLKMALIRLTLNACSAAS